MQNTRPTSSNSRRKVTLKNIKKENIESLRQALQTLQIYNFLYNKIVDLFKGSLGKYRTTLLGNYSSIEKSRNYLKIINNCYYTKFNTDTYKDYPGFISEFISEIYNIANNTNDSELILLIERNYSTKIKKRLGIKYSAGIVTGSVMNLVSKPTVIITSILTLGSYHEKWYDLNNIINKYYTALENFKNNPVICKFDIKDKIIIYSLLELLEKEYGKSNFDYKLKLNFILKKDNLVDFYDFYDFLYEKYIYNNKYLKNTLNFYYYKYDNLEKYFNKIKLNNNDLSYDLLNNLILYYYFISRNKVYYDEKIYDEFKSLRMQEIRKRDKLFYSFDLKFLESKIKFKYINNILQLFYTIITDDSSSHKFIFDEHKKRYILKVTREEVIQFEILKDILCFERINDCINELKKSNKLNLELNLKLINRLNYLKTAMVDIPNTNIYNELEIIINYYLKSINNIYHTNYQL